MFIRVDESDENIPTGSQTLLTARTEDACTRPESSSHLIDLIYVLSGAP